MSRKCPGGERLAIFLIVYIHIVRKLSREMFSCPEGCPEGIQRDVQRDVQRYVQSVSNRCPEFVYSEVFLRLYIHRVSRGFPEVVQRVPMGCPDGCPASGQNSSKDSSAQRFPDEPHMVLETLKPNTKKHH